VDRMVGRAVAYSSGCLRMLGARPLYPLPGERGRESMPPYLKDLGTFSAWMDGRPWDYAWMACDNISVCATYLRNLPLEDRGPYMDLLWSYLRDRQDPQTGFWGGGRPYVRLSGAFKLATLYRAFDRPMPREEALYRSLLKTIREDESEDMCWTRNAMDLLLTLKPQLPPLPEEEKAEILSITRKNLGRYLKADGGFSRHRESSLETPNNVPLGLGLAEGDMNASTQALRIRSLGHELTGIREAPLAEYAAGFYERLSLN
jgi:hypothetical protein